MSDFVDYCLIFYGPGGCYDLGATRQEINAALRIHRETSTIPFEGDSVDREAVRDILLSQRETV